MTLSDEARALAREKAVAVADLPWDALDSYGKREETVETVSGSRFRVKTITFWDLEEWESDMYIIAMVYAERGWRRWWPWKATELRAPPGVY